MTLIIRSWFPPGVCGTPATGSPCDPCKPPPTGLPMPTTPGGWYCVVNQTVWPDYYGGPSIILASVHVGPNGYFSGEFNPTNPYPGKTMLYVALERNVASSSPGYTIGQFSNPADAIAACQAVLANTS